MARTPTRRRVLQDTGGTLALAFAVGLGAAREAEDADPTEDEIPLDADEHVLLEPDAEVDGDVTGRSVEIGDGAEIDGDVDETG